MNPFPNAIGLVVAVTPTPVPILNSSTTGPALNLLPGSVNLVDPSTGPVTLQLPAPPADLTTLILIVVSKGASGAGGGGPITFVANGSTGAGAITTYSPSWSSGSQFGATGVITQDACKAYWLVFSASKNAWVPGN